MLSAILNFFLILLKFSLVLMALTLAGVLLVYLLKAVRLHAVGVGFFMAGIIAYSNASGWSDIRAPILAAVLFVAWIACITKVRAVPKKYYQMKSVSNSVIIAWGALYAFGFGVFALIIPGIAESVPLEGYDWYIYVSLAFLAVTPVILVNGHLEDIEKLGKRLHGRNEIDETECQEMITSLLKADADRDDFDKKHEFVMEYLEMRGVKILWENEAPANTENTTAKLVDRRVSEKTPIEGNMPKANRFPQERIDINNASEAELASVPGIGIILAKKAVALREKQGSFSSVDDFISAVGVANHSEERVRSRVTCNTAESVSPAIQQPRQKKSGRMVDY